MSNSNQGVQALMLAEKRADELIKEAKKRKNLRLKQAKEEALAEIEKFRNECEEKYREKYKDQEDSDAFKAVVEDQKSKRLDEICQSSNAHKEEAINMIIQSVKSIEPCLHRNYRPV